MSDNSGNTEEYKDMLTPCKPPIRNNDLEKWLDVIVNAAILSSRLRMRDEEED